MIKMFWRIGLCVICLLLNIHCAHAYAFGRVNDLFSVIRAEYISSFDSKNIFKSSCDLIHHYDKSLKIYHSSTKAFLYRDNELVESFDFPERDDIVLWQDFITHLLDTSVAHSDKISLVADKLEKAVITNILRQLDAYSRLDNNQFHPSSIDYRIQDNILYLRCDNFQAGTSRMLKKVISQYPLIQGLILDLRHNKGGNFDEAISTADLFLDNVLIAYTSEKGVPNRFYNSTAGDIFDNKPIVVLTGADTASAAEIVAGALSEQGRATLIGTKTYGKGSIQQVHHFSNQTLYLTSGYFYSPSGKAIQNAGLVPQICTGVGGSCSEPLLKNDITTAIKYIKQHLS